MTPIRPTRAYPRSLRLSQLRLGFIVLLLSSLIPLGLSIFAREIDRMCNLKGRIFEDDTLRCDADNFPAPDDLVLAGVDYLIIILGFENGDCTCPFFYT